MATTGCGPPAAKRIKLDLTREIVVTVGPEKKPFTVAQSFLAKSSEFLQACCRGEWKESKTRTIALPAQDPEVFSSYLQWLYTGELVYLPSDLVTSLAPQKDRNRASEIECNALVELAIFADTMRDIIFGNLVIDTLIASSKRLKRGPSLLHIDIIYTRLPATSRVKSWVVDRFAALMDADMLKDHRPIYRDDFLFDLLIRHVEARAQGEADFLTPSYQDRCKYHEHNDQAPIPQRP